MTSTLNLWMTIIILGYDDKKAIVNAIRSVFHTSGHIFCARHVVENVQSRAGKNLGFGNFFRFVGF